MVYGPQFYASFGPHGKGATPPQCRKALRTGRLAGPTFGTLVAPFFLFDLTKTPAGHLRESFMLLKIECLLIDSNDKYDFRVRRKDVGAFDLTLYPLDSCQGAAGAVLRSPEPELYLSFRDEVQQSVCKSGRLARNHVSMP